MTEKKLYGGDVIICFNEKWHIYTLKGDKNKLLSVTGITNWNKPYLLKWAIKCAKETLKQQGNLSDEEIEFALSSHDKISKESMNIGNTTHLWISDYIKGYSPELPFNKASNCIKAFLSWERTKDIIWTESERFIYSKKYNYVGTVDGIFKDKKTGLYHIIDFKTSKSIQPEYLIQAAAYRIAYQEEFPNIQFGTDCILKLDKSSGEFEEVLSDNNELNSKALLCMLSAKKRLETIEYNYKKQFIEKDIKLTINYNEL